MKILLKNKHWKLNKDYDINKILYLLIDRPNIINYYKDFLWFNNKKQWYRKYDLPAHISTNGYLAWFKNGNFYKEIYNCFIENKR